MRSVVTQRLVLRPWSLDDRDVWSRLCTDPDILPHINDGTAPGFNAIAERLRTVAAWKEGPGIFACELLESPGDPIGFSGLAPPNFLPELLPVQEIGWRLLPEHWGKGYATEAATAVLTWASEADLVDRVVACIQPANRRSIGVAERLGMTPSYRTVVPSIARWTDVYELDLTSWEPRQ